MPQSSNYLTPVKWWWLGLGFLKREEQDFLIFDSHPLDQLVFNPCGRHPSCRLGWLIICWNQEDQNLVVLDVDFCCIMWSFHVNYSLGHNPLTSPWSNMFFSFAFPLPRNCLLCSLSWGLSCQGSCLSIPRRFERVGLGGCVSHQAHCYTSELSANEWFHWFPKSTYFTAHEVIHYQMSLDHCTYTLVSETCFESRNCKGPSITQSGARTTNDTPTSGWHQGPQAGLRAEGWFFRSNGRSEY